jgi:ABC-type polysaccharide transport system, permease component
MILPALVFLLIFCYGPMFGVVMAFQNLIPSKGIFGSEWVGLANFKYIFNFPDTGEIIRNTIIIALLKIVVMKIAAISLALLLNEVRSALYKRTIQTIIYLPYFMSWVLLGGILIDVLSPSDGIINMAIKALGFKPIFFLGDNNWFRPTLIVSEIWRNAGWATIIYLAALTNIDLNLYEASKLDGANRWQETWHITLPGILPIIVLMLVLSVGNVLNAGFEQVFNLYNPMVYETGDILDTFVYRLGLQNGQYNVSTAVDLFRSLVGFIFVSGSYYFAYKVADYRVF